MSDAVQPAAGCCPIVELRQYTMQPGGRDVLVELFDRALIEPQEALGAHVVGQFRDEDDPNRFVWVRGFRDMRSRLAALTGFYEGPIWAEHSEVANPTMLAWDDVLLLRPVAPGSGFALDPADRPPAGTVTSPSSLVLVTVYHRSSPVDEEFVRFFDDAVGPALAGAGAQVLARFQTEPAENDYPRLPVRTGQNVFVWFTSFPSPDRYDDHVRRLAGSPHWQREVLPGLLNLLSEAPKQLRLRPTARSLLR